MGSEMCIRDRLIGLNNVKGRATDPVRGPLCHMATIYGIEGLIDEVKIFPYALTDEGRRLMEALKTRLKDEYQRLKELVTMIRDLTDLDYRILACASKLHFILRKVMPVSISTEAIKEKAKEFGWDLTDTQIRRAAEFLLEFLRRNVRGD